MQLNKVFTATAAGLALLTLTSCSESQDAAINIPPHHPEAKCYIELERHADPNGSIIPNKTQMRVTIGGDSKLVGWWEESDTGYNKTPDGFKTDGGLYNQFNGTDVESDGYIAVSILDQTCTVYQKGTKTTYPMAPHYTDTYNPDIERIGNEQSTLRKIVDTYEIDHGMR